MSILKTLGRVWPFSRQGGSRHAGPLYVVDAAGLMSGRKTGDRISPREQLDVVYRLSRFANDEKINIRAVFKGSPLRKIGHGEDYKGVQVYFAKDDERVAKLLLKFVGSNRQGNVLVTDNSALEKRVLSKGGQTMRISTIKRALQSEDSSGGPSSRAPNNRRRRRPRTNNNQRPRPATSSDQRTSDAAYEPSQGNTSEDGVGHLIDLVEEN